MKTTTRIYALIVVTVVLGAAFAAQAQAPDQIVWTDFDSRSIPEPKARSIGYAEYFVTTQMAERWKRGTDFPRWFRLIGGAPKQASNINAVDEVPDSTWYTNRHHLRRMTLEQLARGPNRGAPPDFSKATITKAKLEGVTPGLQLKGRDGEEYLIKFDNKNYPELQSGAEVISTKILYASGYNVPENYISYIDPKNLEIKEGLEIGEGKAKHLFTRDDLLGMLKNAAQRQDGTYRVLASKILKGKAKGPYAHVGIRPDDPNDLIPHEHRRDLRGLRVIASWINHWDMKEMNTLDMYVEENGRKFLRHYLIDFGSTLGGGKSPLEYRHGREYELDTGNMLKEVFTLGFYVAPDEKSAPLVFPEVGIFSAEDFDPEDWKASFRVMPFDNMTREDAFWATRIILSFTDDELLGIVKTAEYSNPRVADYIFRTLLERRRLIAARWLEDVNPLADFAVETANNGIALKFNDLLVDHDLAGRAEYRYEVTSKQTPNGNHRTEKKAASASRIPLEGALGDAIQVRIWTIRENHSAAPVTVYLHPRPEGRYGIFRIERT